MVPELTEAEYVALKAAIREAGRILVPVVVTSDGEVIDGKGRVRAAEELKITNYPTEIVHGVDADARRMQISGMERTGFRHVARRTASGTVLASQ